VAVTPEAIFWQESTAAFAGGLGVGGGGTCPPREVTLKALAPPQRKRISRLRGREKGGRGKEKVIQVNWANTTKATSKK